MTTRESVLAASTAVALGCAAAEPGDAGASLAPPASTSDEASTAAEAGDASTTGQSDDDDAPAASSGPSGTGADEATTTGGAGEPFEPAPFGCITDIDPGVHDFMCDGLVTTVAVADVCVSQPCGVIVDIHGASMTAQQQDNNTALRALGGAAGFIVVQPTTDGFTWMAGHQHRIMTGVNDVVTAFAADPDRVHVTGFSAGAGAAWIMLCEYPEVFASAAPAAATGQYFGAAPVCFGSNPPASELDLLYMNGELDPFESMTHVAQLSDKIVADWAMVGPDAVAGDGNYERVRYASPAGTVFELLTHRYTTDQTVGLGPLLQQPLEGHCIPGSADHGPTEPGQLAGYGCKDAAAFHWGQTVVQFFLDHPR